VIATKEDIEKWRSILAEIEKRLSRPVAPDQARELRAIRAKLKITGPQFLQADLDRLRGMFDKDFL
jgi:hypothetical protein